MADGAEAERYWDLLDRRRAEHLFYLEQWLKAAWPSDEKSQQSRKRVAAYRDALKQERSSAAKPMWSYADLEKRSAKMEQQISAGQPQPTAVNLQASQESLARAREMLTASQLAATANQERTAMLLDGYGSKAVPLAEGARTSGMAEEEAAELAADRQAEESAAESDESTFAILGQIERIMFATGDAGAPRPACTRICERWAARRWRCGLVWGGLRT